MADTPTRYGAHAGDLRAAVAVLRARAARYMPLNDVSDIDAAAAVVGADLWCRIAAVSSLDAAATMGVTGRRVLARLLCRAAGKATSTRADVDAARTVVEGDYSQDTAQAIADAVTLARRYVTVDEIPAVLDAVGQDLSCAGPDVRFAAIGTVIGDAHVR